MKILVVYDSAYGNTEKIAKSIGGTIKDDVKVIKVGEVNPSELELIDFLIVGSPTYAGRPTPAIKKFLSEIPTNALRNIGVASFDTRFSAKDHSFGIRIILGVFGYAAVRIMGILKHKGGYPAAVPEGFIVEGKDGPLKEGELERATDWAKEIVKSKLTNL